MIDKKRRLNVYKTKGKVSDLEAFVSQKDVSGRLFPNEFCEMNGRLYMVYGPRGYGMHRLDASSAAITVTGDTACTVTVDSYWFEQKGEPCTVSFENAGNGWKITAVSGGAQP